jgi:hypothetical protein
MILQLLENTSEPLIKTVSEFLEAIMTTRNTAADHEITVRKLEVDFSETPRHWLDNNPYTTQFVHALSFLFPEGERMFVRSVKHYQSAVKDPQLRRDVAAFIGQEMMHGNIHDQFNDWIASDAKLSAREFIDDVTQNIRKDTDRRLAKRPMNSLALTVALEHFTAVLAEVVLNNEEVLAKMHPSVRPMLAWHALEEIEHKAVAFDVYVASGGGYLRRILWLVLAALVIGFGSFILMFRLLWRDGELFNLKAALGFARTQFGPRGVITSMIRPYLAAFSPSFHPNQTNDRALAATWAYRIEDMAKVFKTSKNMGKQVAV